MEVEQNLHRRPSPPSVAAHGTRTSACLRPSLTLLRRFFGRATQSRYTPKKRDAAAQAQEVREKKINAEMRRKFGGGSRWNTIRGMMIVGGCSAHRF